MNDRKFFIAAGAFVLACAAAGISFATEAPSASMTVAPNVVNVAGTGSNEVFTITKKITGAGGTYSMPIDVIFALDSSGSMQSNDPTNERISASREFLNLMDMDSGTDQAGVVAWEGDIDSSLPLTDSWSNVNSALGNVGNSGNSTNLDVGLTETVDLLDPVRPDTTRKCAIIFLTDGRGNYTPSGNSGSQADRAAGMGCVIYGIGLGSGADMGPLNDMASATGGQAYSVSTANLNDLFRQIYQQISSVPYNITVQETVQDYIKLISCEPVADEGPADDGTVIWYDLDDGAGLPEGDSITLTCKAKCTEEGVNKPIDILDDSYVAYTDNDGKNPGKVGIRQAFITCNAPPVIDCSEATCFRTQLPGFKDHRLEEVVIKDVCNITDPDGDQVTIEITGITSDEPITSGGCEDARIRSDAEAAMVRIERYGRNGRVYEINFTASDGQAYSDGSVQVVIPYDDRLPLFPPRYSCDEVIDDGQNYDATNQDACYPRIKPPFFIEPGYQW
jgi:Ca-activated chloride channel family protein